MNPRHRLRFLRATLLNLLLLGAAGCADYRLQGVVIEGRSPDMQIVSQDDPRLDAGYGLADATVELTIDPEHPRPTRLTPVKSGPKGRFSVPIEAFGAGLLEYEAGLLVRAEGYRPQWHVFELPKEKQRVLVIMVPGPDRGHPNPDLIEDTLRSIPPLD